MSSPSEPVAPLTEGPIASTLIRLAIPIVGANLLQTMYQATDTFWVGRLSAQAVAAVSLVFPLTFLLVSIGGGLPVAGSVLIAQMKGRGEDEAMNHVAGQTCLLSVITSAILSAVGFFWSEPLMRFMGAKPDVLPDATRFMQFTFLGFLFVFGFFAFQTLMRGLGVVRSPMLIVLLTVILNFALDPLFIFGWGPIPAMGVSGAALATLFTQAVAAVIGFWLMSRGYHGIHLKWSDLAPDPALIWRLVRLGFPASVEQSTRSLGMTLMTLLVSSFGTVILAAYGIGMRVLTFVVIPALGLSMATTTLVGQNIGAGKVERAERTSFIAGLIAFFGLGGAGLLLYLVAEPVSRFFVPQGGEAIAESADFIRVTSLAFGFIGIQQVVAGALRGAGDTVAAMFMAIISLWVLQFPLAYVFSRHTSLGAKGIWWAMTVANVIAAIATIVWYMNGGWKRRRLLDADLQEKVRQELAVDEAIAR